MFRLSVQKTVSPVLIHLPWKSLECVLRVGYIVVARTFLFPLQNQLAKIKVVELGPLY